MPSKLRITIASALLVIAVTSQLSPVRSQPIPGQSESLSRAANPNAMPAAQAILDTLYDLTNRPSNRVISGQFGSYGEGQTAATAAESLQRIYDQSGKWVALTGMDYHTWDLYHLHNYAEPNQYLIDQWNKGSLVTLSWHAPNPWTRGESGDRTGAAGQEPNVRNLVTPGAPGYQAWIALLDDVASGLQQLKNAGVVVIWRPLHEMNGGWAWWHMQEQADYVALWQHMFNYFTYTKGLNNLLWAYSPNTNNNQWNKSSSYFYPGSAYVDIVGLDEYMDRGEDPLRINDWHEYDDLVALGKPMGLLEWGPTPADASGWQDPKYDLTRLIRDIRSMYPKIVFFQAWEWIWDLGYQSNVAGLLNDPWVITRDELPNWQGAASLPTTTPVPPTVNPAPTNTPAPPTAVPTNTPIPPTQVSTNSPAPTSPTLKVQYMVGYPNATSREIAAYLKIFNTGITDVPLSQLKLRYWFTRDAAPSVVFNCSYALVGCANVTGTIVNLSSPVAGADSYVEIGFASAAGALVGYDQFSEVDVILGRSDANSFTQTNDYSFDPTKTASVDWSRVTLHNNGALVWGTPPTGAAVPTSTPIPPTVVNTATPIPSTPIATTTTLKLRYKTANSAASSNQFQPTLNIVNTTGSSIPLTEVKVRYYFTRDTAQPLVFHCDWAQVGCANITGRFVKMATPVAGADHYMEIGFRAGSITPNGQTGEIWLRVNKANWSMFNQTNDYSFDPTKTAFADWMKVTLHRNNSLVWGIPPKAAAPAAAPTFVPATTNP